MSSDAPRPTDPATPVVVVTGASSGIGRAVCIRAASQGAHVVLVARGEQSLRTVAGECDASGAESSMVVPGDVGDDAAVAEVVRQVLDRHGRIDTVISNAGVMAYGRSEALPAAVFDGVLRTNLGGAANLARHVVPVLRAQGEGTLLYVGSVIGHIAVPSMTAYAVSKWGTRALVRQLQLENRDLPAVHISYVAPPAVDTPIYRQAANYQGYEGRPPLPMLSPDRVARQILERLDDRPSRAQLSVVNDIMRFGFGALPVVYDALVGPLARRLLMDPARPASPSPGNVLQSREDRNGATGGYRGSLLSLPGEVASGLQALGRRLPLFGDHDRA